nr:response regulator transcription factor [Ktedonobacter sp. SOSP1-52]
MLVEDDPKIVQLLQAHLEKYGYAVAASRDFSSVVDEFERIRPALVLLDINLPRFDGFYWCRQIRKTSTCPILFISARESAIDQVMALENGADDYITKPFSFEVVVAKVGSQLRRAYGEFAVQVSERVIGHAGLLLYPERLQATLNMKTVELSKKEALLLEYLLTRVNRVVNRERLLEALWDEASFVEENTLNVNITRVRKKLQELGLNDALETVRGAGYRLNVTWSQKE